MISNTEKVTPKNVHEIVRNIALNTSEDVRFERLTASRDILSSIYGDSVVYSEVINMLTGNNKFIVELGMEQSINKRYRMVFDKICSLTTMQFSAVANLITPLKFHMLLKDRCEVCNDSDACVMLGILIHGDLDSEVEAERLGLMGLWETQHNRHAGSILVEIGVVKVDDFEKSARSADSTACELAMKAALEVIQSSCNNQ